MESPDDAAAKVFDIVYDDYTNHDITKKEICFIASQIKTNGYILDVGCGTGRHMIPLIELGYAMTGIDNSGEMLKVLRSKLKKRKLESETIHENIYQLRDFEEKFDGTICFWNAFTQIATSQDQGNRLLGYYSIR